MAKSIFEILISLPPPDDPRWDIALEKFEEQRRAARAKAARLARMHKRMERRGARGAARALATLGEPATLIGALGQRRHDLAVKAMELGQWYTADDVARLTGTWRSWARDALKWAKVSGWVEYGVRMGANGLQGRREWLRQVYRLTPTGEVYRRVLELDGRLADVDKIQA